MADKDEIAARVRRCRHCGGDMTCRNLTQWTYNGGNSGREYLFVCQGCKKMVTELSRSRTILQTIRIVSFLGLAILMVAAGLKILVGMLQHGAGGNDMSALVVVLVLFLGIGLPFLGLMLWWGYSTLRDRRELEQNPVVR